MHRKVCASKKPKIKQQEKMKYTYFNPAYNCYLEIEGSEASIQELGRYLLKKYQAEDKRNLTILDVDLAKEIIEFSKMHKMDIEVIRKNTDHTL